MVGEKDLFIQKETLDILSYKSTLGKKFKADIIEGNTVTKDIRGCREIVRVILTY